MATYIQLATTNTITSTPITWVYNFEPEEEVPPLTLYINTGSPQKELSPDFKPFVGNSLSEEGSDIWLDFNRLGVHVPTRFAKADLEPLRMNHVIEYRFCRACFGYGKTLTETPITCAGCGGSGSKDVVLQHHGPGNPTTLDLTKTGKKHQKEQTS